MIEEVQASETPVILFIDEAHTLIGAGGAAGTGDAANLLKPALARGELRTIAATTWSEYKQYIEKDPALTRRFQVVKVEEPEEAAAVQMLRGVAAVLEKHHQVQILDEAIEAAVALSHRYIPARQLPDKAVSLLDTACARVAVSQHATPAEVEDLRRRRRCSRSRRGSSTARLPSASTSRRGGRSSRRLRTRHAPRSRPPRSAGTGTGAGRADPRTARPAPRRGRAARRGGRSAAEPALAEAGDVRRPKPAPPSRTLPPPAPDRRPTSPSCGASPPNSRRRRARRR